MARKASVNKNKLVFGLDIGTRSIVGIVGYMDARKFVVTAMSVCEHETRAMLDGQIHDIYKVGDTIRRVKNELESQTGETLTDVCIAAAGRVLRTVNSSADFVFEEDTRVTSEHIYSLNLLAVEKAHSEINSEDSKEKFYCVGHTPITYKLNGFDISNLEGHKASSIAVELIATFLPEEVVDGLYEAVEYAGLNVASLTLEPIAAMNIAIPEQYRLLNIGLVDVGAGTSDICLTKDGSIIAYGMIPIAGDEITEVIAKNYLVDFNTAEQIKMDASANPEGEVTFNDIMGLGMTVKSEEVSEVTTEIIDNMAKATADKIIELNGGRPVNAVFVVGGGGKMIGYTDSVAKYLGIVKERVAVRGEEVLTTVDFQVKNYTKDALFVTPVGICTNYYLQKNSFVFVTVNNQRVKMYDNSHLTVVDAVMQIGFPNEKLFPRRGPEITYTVNGKTRIARGLPGEGAVVKLNGKNANLSTPVEQNDVIQVVESTFGEAAHITISQLDEFKSCVSFNVNGKKVLCPKFAYVNGELKSEFYEINNGDDISMENYYTVEQLFAFLDMDLSMVDVYVNNELADKETLVYENFNVKTVLVGTVQNDTSDDATEDIVEENLQESVRETVKEPADEDVIEDVMDEEVKDEAAMEAAATVESSVDGESSIVVVINNQPIKLTGKSEYVLVDIFDFYDFDLTRPQGKNVVLKLNGGDCEYIAPLKDGDIIDLYWEK
ncbi:MAG: rod shape-determining protein [Lachnospira sp.]|nr:rod shape-determining protein [Lachnospira sp.]